MRIDKYSQFTDAKEIEYIKKLGSALSGADMRIIADTAAPSREMNIQAFKQFAEEFGAKISVEELKMPPEFTTVIDRFYKALQDPFFEISDEDLKIYESCSDRIASRAAAECDICLAEELHPLSLSAQRGGFKRMIWHCCADLSTPNPKFFAHIKKYLEKYDVCVFSMSSFFPKADVNMRALLPSIDPLSEKNREMTAAEISFVFSKYKIPRDKKIIFQLARFDASKDPLGALDVFAEVKKEFDVSLVLAGFCPDCPQGNELYLQTLDKAAALKDAYVLSLGDNNFEVNALQRGADIVLQKSLKGGFALAVTEALWKEKPVIASDIGGMPAQVLDGVTGLLCSGKQNCVMQIKKLLKNPAYGRELARAGKKHVQENFLITRHIRDAFQIFGGVMESIRKEGAQ